MMTLVIDYDPSLMTISVTDAQNKLFSFKVSIEQLLGGTPVVLQLPRAGPKHPGNSMDILAIAAQEIGLPVNDCTTGIETNHEYLPSPLTTGLALSPVQEDIDWGGLSAQTQRNRVCALYSHGWVTHADKQVHRIVLAARRKRMSSGPDGCVLCLTQVPKTCFADSDEIRTPCCAAIVCRICVESVVSAQRKKAEGNHSGRGMSFCPVCLVKPKDPAGFPDPSNCSTNVVQYAQQCRYVSLFWLKMASLAYTTRVNNRNDLTPALKNPRNVWKRVCEWLLAVERHVIPGILTAGSFCQKTGDPYRIQNHLQQLEKKGMLAEDTSVPHESVVGRLGSH